MERIFAAWSPEASAPVRYGGALLAVAVTHGLRLLLDPFIGHDTPFVVLYFLPVVVAAWRSGQGPALVAGAAGLAIGDIVSVDLTNGVPWEARVVRVGTFMAETALLGWILSVHRHQKRARARSDQRYRVLAENFPQGALLMIDRDLRYTLATGPALEAMGLRVDGVLGCTPMEVLGVEAGSRAARAYRRALEGEEVDETFQQRGRHLRARTGPVRETVGGALQIVAAVTVILDVTDQVHLEAARERAETLRAMGHLAGGVAHDFNNLLLVIFGWCDELAMDLSEAHPQREAVEGIQGAAERARGLVQQLVAFSREQSLDAEPLDLAELVRGVAPMLRAVVREGAEVELDVAGPAPVVMNRTEAERVLTNLCANARDAMPGGRGRVRIQLRVDDAASEVVLVVSDDGVGMSAQTQARLFEPFYSTKGRDGTGLGLFVVQSFVRTHQGHVDVDSELDRGTTFTLRFPLATGSAGWERGPQGMKKPGGSMEPRANLPN